jgi:hypothetical protein
MRCNDKRCASRSSKTTGGACDTRDCSHSSYRNKHPLHSLVSTVVITAQCSSQMIRKLEEYALKPVLFHMGTWKKVSV